MSQPRRTTSGVAVDVPAVDDVSIVLDGDEPQEARVS